jgi:dTDP-4-dehydrorhamnose reductase
MVCDGETSRLEVTKEIITLLGLQNKVSINEVSSEYFIKDYFAARPPCERLINKKLNLRGLNLMRDWRIALKEYLADYYKDYLG